MKALVAAVALLTLIGCQSKTPPPPPPPAPKAEAPAPTPPPEPPAPPAPECQYTQDCRFGRYCEDGTCKESQCWDKKPGIEAKNCPEGMNCEYQDDQGIRHGNGYCFPARPQKAAPKRRR